MGKIVMSDFISVDGVVEDPLDWVGDVRDQPELGKVLLDEALGTDALLLGRRTYEFLAPRWPSRTGALADKLNGVPKYVVSSTLEDPEWSNSTVVKGELVEEVSQLKQAVEGEINLPASFQVARTLMEHDLVDELRLRVYPVVLGAGARLFGETSDKKPLRVVDVRATGDGVALLTYVFDR